MCGGVISARPITLQRMMRPTKCTYCSWVIFRLRAVDCNLLLLRQQLMCFMETACEIIFRRSFSFFSYHKNESISKQAFCWNCHEVISINDKGSCVPRAFYAQKWKLCFLSTLTNTYYISHGLYTCENILVKREHCSNWSVIACKTFYFRVHFILFDKLFFSATIYYFCSVGKHIVHTRIVSVQNIVDSHKIKPMSFTQHILVSSLQAENCLWVHIDSSEKVGE